MNLDSLLENAEKFKINLDKFKIDENFYSQIYLYLKYLNEWSLSHNLVSSKQESEDLFLSVYDSLFGASFLSFPEMTHDAGSGGGFPGMVLAIALPEYNFTLVELNRKKCSFLRSVKAKLALKNVTITQENIEKVAGVKLMITKAAFSPPNIAKLAPVIENGGHLAVWATPHNSHQFSEALAQAGLKGIEQSSYELPTLIKRHLLLFAQVI